MLNEKPNQRFYAQIHKDTYDVLFGRPEVCLVCAQPAVMVLFKKGAVCENHIDDQPVQTLEHQAELA